MSEPQYILTVSGDTVPTLEYWGSMVIHTHDDDTDLSQACQTFWPATTCTCGHFRLQWQLAPTLAVVS